MSDAEKAATQSRTGWFARTVRRAHRLVLWVLDLLGKYELTVLVALLLISLASLIFVLLASEMIEGETQSFDTWMLRTLRRADDPSRPIGPDWLAEVARDLTALGGVAFLTLLVAAVCGFLWLRAMRGAMWLVLLATLGGLISSTLLKAAFARPRPTVVPYLSAAYSSSFPSGHSMLSATVFLTLGALLGRFVHKRRLKAYFLIVALLLTGLVGASRVYMGVHYPTDVMAGWVAGLAWASLCWLVARQLQRRGAVEKEARTSRT